MSAEIVHLVVDAGSARSIGGRWQMVVWVRVGVALLKLIEWWVVGGGAVITTSDQMFESC